jgi:hypothetical protein
MFAAFLALICFPGGVIATGRLTLGWPLWGRMDTWTWCFRSLGIGV